MKDFYLYNYLQSDFFLQHGLSPIQIGKGNKDDIFVRFIRDDKSELVFNEWKERKYGIDTRLPREI